MSLLINITGPRASGKTTTAMKMAGEDAYQVDGYMLSEAPERLQDAPSDKNWLVRGEGMDAEDWAVLNSIARSGEFNRLHGAANTRASAPAMIVVDNGIQSMY